MKKESDFFKINHKDQTCFINSLINARAWLHHLKNPLSHTNITLSVPSNKFLPERTRFIALSNLLIQPFRLNDTIATFEKERNHENFCRILFTELNRENANNEIETNIRKYISLVIVRDIINGVQCFTNSKPRNIVAKNIQPVLQQIITILPNDLAKSTCAGSGGDASTSTGATLSKECMAISVSVLKHIRVQVGCVWCSKLVDTLMDVVTKSKNAFTLSLTGSEASQTILGKFIQILEICLTCRSQDFMKRFDTVEVLKFIVNSLWKQLTKYADTSDNGVGLKNMVVQFLTNVLCYRWRSFYPEMVGKWKEGGPGTNFNGNVNQQNQQNMISSEDSNNNQETLANGQLVTQILEIFATVIHDSSNSHDVESFSVVLNCLDLLQTKRNLFTKQIFQVHLKDFSILLMKAWQSGNNERVKESICNLLYRAVLDRCAHYDVVPL